MPWAEAGFAAREGRTGFPVRPFLLVGALALLCLFGALAPVPEQTLAQGARHILFGDVRVDESEADQLVPQTFQIVLRNLAGVILGRETVAGNGRYRFADVANGEYSLAVEVEGREVARISITIAAFPGTYIRQDIPLTWRQMTQTANRQTPPRGGSVVYSRSRSHQKLFQTAQKEMAGGRLERAIAILTQVVREDGADFEAWTELGTLHFKNGNLKEAEAAYLQAVSLQPDYLLALLNLGKLRVAAREYEAAVEMLGRVIRLDSQRAEAFYFLGEACLQARRGTKAVEYFRRALELDAQGMADAHLRLGALYEAAGYSQQALQEYEQFLSKRPDYPQREQLQEYIVRNKKPVPR